MLNIIIFGTGKVFEKKIDTILTCNNLKIVGYIDNNPLKIGKRIQGKSVYNPEMIKDLSYDYVLITSENYLREMEEQLLAFGVPSGKILFWEKLCNLIKIGEMAHYGNFKEKKDKSMLIITAFLNYTGSSIAVFYLAQIANKLGYNVEIACPEVDLDFVEEVVREGITVSVYPQLPFINNIDISEYDFVVVNVFLMMISAIQLNGRVPVLWWLHESGTYTSVYKDTLYKYKDYIKNSMQLDYINIAGVSEMANENFDRYLSGLDKRTLMLGIPDVYMSGSEKKHDKLIIAIIGRICELKGQHILIQAIEAMKDEKQNLEVWFIGEFTQDVCCNQVKRAIQESTDLFKYKGVKSRQEMKELYQNIDVVVCASLEESLSMTIVEGMMNEKICITTDATGIAKYVEHGVNGLVCKANNPTDLKNCIKRVIEHPERIQSMRINARKTYEKIFSMKTFENRIKDEIAYSNMLYEKRYKNE